MTPSARRTTSLGLASAAALAAACLVWAIAYRGTPASTVGDSGAVGGRVPGAAAAGPEGEPPPSPPGGSARSSDGDRSGPSDSARAGASGLEGAAAPAWRARAAVGPADGVSAEGVSEVGGAADAGPPVERVVRLVETGSRRPLADATVIALSGRLARRATTGDDGRARLAWPEELAAELVLRHRGHVDRRCPAADLAAEAEFALEPSAVLELELLPAPPTPGRVGLWRRVDGGTRWRALDPASLVPDGSGSARIAFVDLVPGEYALAGDFGASELPFEAGVDLGPGARARLVRAPRDAALLGGRVVDAAGGPLPGAELTLARDDPTLPGELARDVRRAATDGSGRFAFGPAPAGAWRVLVRGPDGGRAERALLLGRGATDLSLTLASPLRRAGRVVDGAGAPVAGAEVGLVLGPAAPADRLGIRASEGPWSDDPLADGSLSHVAVTGSPVEGAATTDAEGRYRLEDPWPGRPARLEVRPPAGSGLGGSGLDLAPRGALGEMGALPLGVDALGSGTEPQPTDDWPLLVLPRAAAVAGRVRGPAADGTEGGQPATGVRVGVVRADVPSAPEVAFGLTDADGRFGFEGLAPGRIHLLARGTDGAAERRTLALGAGERVDSLELVLEPRHVLRCRTVDRDGLALPGITLRAHSTDREGRPVVRGPRTSDQVGRLVFVDLPPGPVRLEGHDADVERVEPWPGDPRLPFEGELELVVERRRPARPATVRGAAVAVEDGAAPTGLVLEGLPGGTLLVEGTDFRVVGVRPGRVRPVLRASGRAPLELEPFELAPGAEHDLGRLELEAAVAVELRLVDRRGDPVDAARVELRRPPVPAGTGARGRSTLVARPRGAGRFAVEDAAVGPWRIVVLRAGRPPVVEPVRLEPLADGEPWARTLVLDG